MMKDSDKMIEQLKNNDIVITEYKTKILKELFQQKKMIHLKLMTKEEFNHHYFGKPKNKAIYYLMEKYHYAYDVAKVYLENFLWIDSIHQELEQNNLIEKDPLFSKNIERIVLLEEVDPYLQKEIEKYNCLKLIEETGINDPNVFELDTLEEEVNNMFIQIEELLRTVPIQKIGIIKYPEEYQNMIRRYSFLYHIPVCIKEEKSLYGLIEVQQFLKNIKEKSIEESLENIVNKEIYNLVIDICNPFMDCENKDILIEIIEQELKQATISSPQEKNAVQIVEIDEVQNENYYFLLGFNQGIVPVIHKDEDFLSDILKQEKGIFTSEQKNKIEKNKIIKLIQNTKHLFLSYKLKSYSEEYYPSSLIEELNLKIIKPDIQKYNYSNLYNKIMLAKKLDNFIKFNEKDSSLNLLYHNLSNIHYLTFDNKYHTILKEDFQKYTNDKLLLSYSSLDNYNRCSFRYYVANLLKLNKYEETFMTLIGNLFHYILSIAFTDNFDFEKEFNQYLKAKELTNKETFFLEKLKQDLKYTIDIIKEQDQTTKLKDALYEQKIFINQNHHMKVTFMGIVDKLKYHEENGQTVVAIIDYKTGTPEINLNNSIYGIEMQLPIYLYLTKHSKLKNVKVAGFYLQKIVHNKLPYQKENYEKAKKKLYRLDGYSSDDINLLSQLDSNYSDSTTIKGMKTSSKGFYAYTKVLNDKQIDNLESLTKTKIEETTNNILDLNFTINPKKIGQNLVGCEFCTFQDICYKKEEDTVYLKEHDYHDFLGGE